MHAMEWYFELILRGVLDVSTPILTHRYRPRVTIAGRLPRLLIDQGASGAVKVLFDRFPEA